MTLLAQLTAGALGTGWTFYVSNLSVALVLGLAANTSFGGLPVLMSLLAKDHRLPHFFYLRAERPVYRYGIVVLAMLAGAAADRGQGRDVPADPAVHDRRVRRVDDQPGGARRALVASTSRRGGGRARC